MRVAIIQELLAQYRVPFYEALRSTLASADIQLDLFYGRASGQRALRRDEATLPWAVAVAGRAWRPTGTTTFLWQPVFSQVRTADLVVVEHANKHLINYLLLAAQPLRLGPRVAFWGHGANLQAPDPNSLAEKFKRGTARLPHWWFAYSDGSALRVASAGFPRDRITVVQNTIDTSEYTPHLTRRKFPNTCVFVGALHEHKRIAYLLEAAKEAAQALPGFSLSIVGDGPLRRLVEAAAETEPWLRYHGALYGSAKAEVVSSATLTLMPGGVGLGIIESFGAQTPVVTIDGAGHGPEIEYAHDGTNAILMNAGTDPAQYARRVVDILQDRPLLSQLQGGCSARHRELTVTEMVRRYAKGVQAALQMPPRSSGDNEAPK